ncbi:MAG: D-alpha,beta-D-heptose 1,7-bisphosphate phosphatase [Sphingobacterium sp.]|jgi:D-glycero-D-manno-heptose 1,7-bisphosphate phosphatase|nr:D-alpha,beta-D-heptose 1,7-bisphosphate phosphatase [Sphingobacterium sp.]
MNFKKALFLDRDGVINIDKGYVFKIEDFEFVEGIFEVCKLFQSNDYLIIVVTNQSGIAKKYYTKHEYYKLTEWMLKKFRENGILISQVYFCPKEDGNRRKPNPGMLLEAKQDFNLDLNQCFLIGDKKSDIDAAKNAGLKHYYFAKSNEKINLMEVLSIVDNCEI